MKNIQTYEAFNMFSKEKLNQYKFKVGQFVKIGPNTRGYAPSDFIYEIIGINMNDPYQPYNIKDSNDIVYSVSGDILELAPDYEVDAINYNL
jgi:hypothetical protein